MGYLAFLLVYLLGGLTALPLLVVGVAVVALWTSVPVGDVDPSKAKKRELQEHFLQEEKAKENNNSNDKDLTKQVPLSQAKPPKGWVTVRRTFDDGEGALFEGSYMDLMRSILDSRSKDPKKSRPKDTYFAVLKSSVLFLYEDEAMTDCHAALEMSIHKAEVYPYGLLDGELFTKRNAIKLSTKREASPSPGLPHVTKEMKFDDSKEVEDAASQSKDPDAAQKMKEIADQAREEAFDFSTPWYIFVRSVAEMEDWYHALVHASAYPNHQSTFESLQPVFSTEHMQYLVSHLDTQPDPIPMRWFNALVGRLFFSVYRTAAMEKYIIGRLMKKLAKVKKPSFLADIVVTEVSVGETAPTFYKPMLKELTKEGDAAVEVGVHYQGEIRITVETTATINLGARFRTYEVKLVLAVVLRELEGNLLIKIKPPPSNRVWYAFTKMPKMALSVEPIVSDRQLTWGMILKTIEGRLKEIILESVVLPNYDDIAFFETSKFENRGGIYADAVRSVHKKPDMSAPPIQETQSLPVVETAPPLSRDDSMEDFKMPGHFSSHSPPPVVPSITAASEPALASIIEPVDVQKTSDSVTVLPLEESTPTVLGNVLVEPPSPIPDEPSSRERAKDVSEEGSLKASRGDSVPASRNSTDTDAEADQGLNLPSRRTTGRSSPASSSRRLSHSASQSADVTSSSQQPTPVTTASTFNLPSSVTSGDSKAPTSSFLMNLKNRAAAAANAAEASNPKAVAQARETIQKWGVQWAGLKKNIADAREARAGSAQASPSPATSSFPANIHGSPTISVIEAPSSPLPAATNSISRGFDDMRRILAEKKQREERERVVSDVGKSTPLDVPVDRSKSKRRESAGPVLLSQSEEVTPSGKSAAGSPTRSRLSRSDSVGNVAEFIQPPSAKSVPTVVETLLDASPSTRPRQLSDASGSVKTAPSSSQPSYSPMTMTIPGIHAKNRDSVMAIGFSPAPQPSAAPAKEDSGVGSKIGNIYRLLNRNNQGASSDGDAVGTLPSLLARQQEAQQAAVPEGDAETSVSNAPTPNPEAVQTATARSSTEATPSSPASAALMSLVARDDIARRKSLTRRRTGSLSEYPTRQRSDSTSSSPLSSSFSIPVTEPPVESESVR